MKKFFSNLKLEYLRYKNFKRRVKDTRLTSKETWATALIPLLIIIVIFFIPYSFIFSAGIFDLLNGGKFYIFLFIITTFGANYIYNKVRYEMLFKVDEDLEVNLNFKFVLLLDTCRDTVIYSIGALLCLYIGGSFL